MRVLIAEPYPLLHAAIRAQVEQLFSPSVFVGPHVSNGNDALRLLTEKPWDLFITEIMLSTRDGLQVIRRLRSAGRTVPSLVLTTFREDVFGIEAVRAGASGFVHKSASLPVLRRALKRVAEGRRYVSDNVAERLADATPRGDRGEVPHERLTGRERQIFLMLSLGQAVREIADELCVARKTVYAHRARIFKKLRAATDGDLRRYAFAHGIVPSRRLSDLR